MKNVKYILFISIVAIAFSCKQAEAPAEELPLPVSTFDATFPKNNKQLSKIFGKMLLIKKNSDTLFLKIASTKNDNLITDAKTGDTIFYGKVCKFREFYYFNNKVNDTSYYISAFKIKGNLLYSLNRWSQYLEVDENIVKGNCKELVKSINADTSSIRLMPNKKELKKLFGLIMSKSIPDTILNSKSDLKAINQNQAELDKEENEFENYNIKVYPNPATEYICINLNRKSFFKLSNFNRKIVFEGKLNELENKIDISNQKSGIYILEISDIEKGEKRTLKIAINR